MINTPFDFFGKNRLGLADLPTALQSVIFPGSVPGQQRFRLTADDYLFLYQCMPMLPRQSRFPQYDPHQYPDGYVNFLLFDGEGPIGNPSLHIFNKVGHAYGF